MCMGDNAACARGVGVVASVSMGDRQSVPGVWR